jgi:outer membrane receptor for ferrienterochelin and colicins
MAKCGTMRVMSLTKISAPLILCGALHLSLHQACAAETQAGDSGKLKEMSIEQLMEVEVDTVYGASRYEQKLGDAPSSVTIVTADQIRKFGYRTLADILRSVRGFYVTNDRNYSYVGVRGFGRPSDYNSRILIQLNGHRLNDNLYGGAYVGQDTVIDVDLIDRVEIIRGPSSSIYGNSAFFAVVNMISKKGEALGGAEMSASAASYDTYKGRISYGNLFPNGFHMLLSGSGFYSDGHDSLYYKEYDDPSTNFGKTRHTDYENGFNFFGSLSYGDFTLEGAYNSREKGVPTGSYGTDFNEPGNFTIDDYGYADLKYEKEFDSGLGMVARTYYNHVGYRGDYIYSAVVNKDSSSGDQWGLDLMARKSFGKHTFVAGSEFEYNLSLKQRNYNQEPYQSYLDDRRNSWKYSLYAQDEFAIHRMLTLDLGVRWDYYDTFGSTVNPRLALIFKPFETTALKFIYGEAFRAPNAYELYYNDSGQTAKANDDLKPESIRTYEFIYEQKIADWLNGSVSFFHYDIDNLISQINDPVDSLLVYRNIDKVDANGVEVELDGKWGSGFEARGSYSYQYAKNNSTDQWLSNSPKHLAKVNVVIPLLPEKIFSGIELQYTGKRKTLTDEDAGGFILANITLFGRNLLKNLEFSASIYNLFDKKYGDPGGPEHIQNPDRFVDPGHPMNIIEQDGRTFRVKLTYKF